MPNEPENGIERRFFSREVRMVEGKDGQKKIAGYGAVFSSISEDLGGFKELIMPGAFSEVMGDDVRSTFNHDPNLILGRTVSGTLAIAEDEVGLHYEVEPPDTQAGRDAVTSIERGDVDQSSFGFRVLEDSWRHPTEDEPLPIRVIHKYQRLYDVGPVTFAAYPVTTVSVRALDKARQLAASTGGATGETEAEGAARRLALKRRRLELAEKH